MKILYYSPIYFSDVDISYLHEMQQLEDITWVFPIGATIKGAAVNISALNSKPGLFKVMDLYPNDFNKFSEFIDLDKVYVLNNSGRRGYSWQNIWCQICFFWFILTNNFSVIHITEMPKYFERWLYAFKSKILLTVHDPFSHSCFDGDKSVENRRRLAFNKLSNFLVLNKAQKKAFLEYYQLQQKKVFDSRLGRYDYLTIYNPQQRPIEQKYILFFGQISSHKGLDYLLPAMQKVHEQHPNVHLIVAGRGTFHFDITPYQKTDYIHFYHRFIPDEELAALIKFSEFVVCPYIDATQSGVVMSAYAFNKPVVATNVGGLPEMVIHNELGEIVPPCDVESLQTTIELLLQDSIALQKYTSNIAIKYTQGILSWSYIAQEMVQIYHAI